MTTTITGANNDAELNKLAYSEAMFAIYDAKAVGFLPPFISHNKYTALRAFKSAANDPQHDFCRHAEDYTLYYIGQWDPTVGFLTQDAPHEALANAKTLQETP